MDFQELEERFLDHLRRKIRGGELTERRLARMAGISQPHVHNVLKGKRLISLELADALLHAVRLDLADLVHDDEFTGGAPRPMLK